MGKKGLTIFIAIILIPLASHAGEFLSSNPLEEISVLQISSADERAVIQAEDGKLQMVKIGDLIGNRNGKIVEITSGRIVVEEGIGLERETAIIRIKKGKQTIERIKKAGEKQPFLYMPK